MSLSCVDPGALLSDARFVESYVRLAVHLGSLDGDEAWLERALQLALEASGAETGFLLELTRGKDGYEHVRRAVRTVLALRPDEVNRLVHDFEAAEQAAAGVHGPAATPGPSVVVRRLEVVPAAFHVAVALDLEGAAAGAVSRHAYTFLVRFKPSVKSVSDVDRARVVASAMVLLPALAVSETPRILEQMRSETTAQLEAASIAGHELTALAAIARGLSGAPPGAPAVHEALRSILRHVASTLGSCIEIVLIGSHGENLRFIRADRSIETRDDARKPDSVNKFLRRVISHDGEFWGAAPTFQDIRWIDARGTDDGEQVLKLPRNCQGVVSLHSGPGAILGTLGVARRDRPFTPGDLDFLEATAHVVSALLRRLVEPPLQVQDDLRLSLELLDDAVVVTDIGDRIVFANRAARARLKLDEVRLAGGLRVADLPFADLVAAFVELLDGEYENTTHNLRLTTDPTGRRPEQDPWASLRMAKIVDPGTGVRRGVILSLRNIDEEKQFTWHALHDAIHDLRRVSDRLELLQQNLGLEGGSPDARSIDGIRGLCESAVDMMQRVPVTILREGIQPRKAVELDLVSEVGEVVAGYEEDFRLHRHGLVFDPDGPSPAPVLVAREDLLCILKNVLGNSLKFSLDQTDLTVTVRLVTLSGEARPVAPGCAIRGSLDGCSGWRLVSVADQGPGVTAKDLDDIFRFGVTSRPAVGQGIGLAVCARLVTGWGGAIGVYNNGSLEARAPGCTVFFTVPPARGDGTPGSPQTRTPTM